MNDIIIGRDAADREKYGDKGVIYLGKHYIRMGRTTSLSNKVFLDVTKSHVVFVCGKRGGGKCLTGDSEVLLEDGTLKRIDALTSDHFKVLSLGKDLKMHLSSKTGFYQREVETTYRIALRSGKNLRLTPEHPLFTLNGWMPAEKLSIGSRIAVPRRIPVFGDDDLPEEKVKLIAYLLSEGQIGPKFLLFSNKDGKINEDFVLSIKQFDPSLGLKTHGDAAYRVICSNKRSVVKPGIRDRKGRFAGGHEVDSNNPLRNWLRDLRLWGLKSNNKFIPEEIFKLPEHKLSIFLNRMFSCDGSIYLNYGWNISYSSVSEQMCRQVQHLLLRFGVVSKLRVKSTKSKLGKSYELVIKGEFVKIYLEKIGFYGEKEARQKEALKTAISIKRNSNIDTIPKELWNNYSPDNWASMGRFFGYKHPKAMRESARYSVSRQKLLQIAKYEENESLLLLAESDIFWDEIVLMEKIDEKVKVYDFTVPGKHNFVANDVIVHNSYTLGVIAEGVADLPPEVKQNISVILLDTMGVFWTMKFQNKQDKALLEEWNLEGKPLDVKIFTPTGYHDDYKDKGIPTDYPFSIKPSELSGSDWNTTFGVSQDDPVGVLIERTIHELQEKGKDYSMKDIIKKLDEDKETEKNTISAAKNRFGNADKWGLFSEKGTSIDKLAMPGQVTVLDVSCYATMPGSWNIKNLVVGLISQKLFIQRMIARKEEEYLEVHKSANPYGDEDIKKQEFPLVWLVLDEAHEFLPVDEKTLATDPLITILREGRQPGVSLILATQQPGKIHTDVMTQSDTVIAHRITAKMDTEALGTLMQSYMRKGLVAELDALPREKGAAIIFDDTNERMYPMRVRPRFTWHGGGAPSAIHDKKKS